MSAITSTADTNTMQPQLADATTRARLSEIDQSALIPGLFFLVSAVGWLLIGTFLALIASVKLTTPQFLSDYSWMTFSHARVAHLNAMIYGWSNNVIFAVIPWIMCRLCQTRVRHTEILIMAGVFWNLAVTIGIGGILFGDMTSVEWLEMPTYITPMIAISYVLIGVWGVIAFRFRNSQHIYVSQWYILAALFWFPWLYSIAQIMILWEPAVGTVQSLCNWWFAHNVLGLWLTPMGLAVIYYLIPKVLGVPIHSYYLSILGFWTLALFYNWAGVHHLIGGPVPVWVVSAGTVGSVMMVIPVVVTAINHHLTVKNSFNRVWQSPTLRFIVFGGMMYTAVSLAGSSMALRHVNEITHFTHFTVGHAHHGVYAFFTMSMFGAVYFFLPRIVRRDWPSSFLISAHWWCVSIGIIIMLIGLHIGGFIQGLELNNPDIPFIDVVRNTVPWLHSRSLSGVFLTVGHIAFSIHVAWILIATLMDKFASIQSSKDATGNQTFISGQTPNQA